MPVVFEQSPTPVQPPSALPPAAPSLVLGTVTTTSVALTWTQPPRPGANPVAFWIVYRNGIAIATQVTASFTDTGLKPNTPYWYWVIANDNQSTPLVSNPSNTVATTTQAAVSFDFFVGPSGLIGNSGTLPSAPWPLGAVNKHGPNYKSQTAGKRIGALPGVYDPIGQGTVQGFTDNFISLPNGTASNPTYFASCDVNGNEIPVPGLYNAGGASWNGATIDGTASNFLNNPPTSQCGLIGSSSTTGDIYCTMSGIEVRGGLANPSVWFGVSASQLSRGVRLVNNWLHSSTNAQAITFLSPPTGTSGTLNAPWTGATNAFYGITFSDGQLHTSASLTNGSPLVSWSGAITGSPTINATVGVAGINPGVLRLEYTQSPYLGNNFCENATSFEVSTRAGCIFIWASTGGIFEYNTVTCPSGTLSAGNPLFDYKAQNNFGHTLRYNYIDASANQSYFCLGMNDYGTQSTAQQSVYGNVMVAQLFMRNQESDGLYFPSSNRFVYNNTLVGLGSTVTGILNMSSPITPSLRWFNNIITRTGVYANIPDLQSNVGGIFRADYNCYGATSGIPPAPNWRINQAQNVTFSPAPGAGALSGTLNSNWTGGGSNNWEVQFVDAVVGGPVNRGGPMTMTPGSPTVNWGSGPLPNAVQANAIIAGYSYPTNTTVYSGFGTGAGQIGSLNPAFEANSAPLAVNPQFTGTGVRAQLYQLQVTSPLKNAAFIWNGDTNTGVACDLGAWGVIDVNTGLPIVQIGSNLKG